MAMASASVQMRRMKAYEGSAADRKIDKARGTKEGSTADKRQDKAGAKKMKSCPTCGQPMGSD